MAPAGVHMYGRVLVSVCHAVTPNENTAGRGVRVRDQVGKEEG